MKVSHLGGTVETLPHRHCRHDERGEEWQSMSDTPPVGWADVATKRDLDQLADRFDAKLAQLQLRLVLWFVGTGVAVVGATGVVRFV